MKDEKFDIICVDDEADILEMAADIVTSLDYNPVTFPHPLEALEYIKENSDSIVLIVSDFKMPKMNGFDFRKEQLELCPDIPYLLVSGHVTKDMALQAVDLKISAFVEKPIDIKETEKVISKFAGPRREVLEEAKFLAGIFFEEANEILEDLEPLLLNLEENPEDMNTLNTIYRLVHTIKGSSGVLKLPEFTSFLHKYEDFLSELKDQKRKADQTAITFLLRGYDMVGEFIRQLETHQMPKFEEHRKALFSILDGKGQGNDDNTQAADSLGKKETLNVPLEVLDEFMGITGEITVLRNMINNLVKRLKVHMEADTDVNLLSELLEEMHKLNGAMQQKVGDLRKTSIAPFTRKLKRLVRDTSTQLSKQIDLRVKGDQICVDNSLSTTINNCLTHMIRNSIDHGIETPEARTSNGKKPKGTVDLEFREDGTNVYINIKDDGKGIDSKVIGTKLVEKNILSETELGKLSNDEIIGYIFHPGFSTAKAVTDISGRGVGMDMVKTSINDMGGKISTSSTLGKGTQFNITLPIPKSVTIINALSIKVGDHNFAIPQDSISRVMTIPPARHKDHLHLLEGSTVLSIEGVNLPIISLNNLISGKKGTDLEFSPDQEIKIIVVESDQGRYCINVDQINDTEDAVIKTLNPLIRDIGIYKGATFTDNGDIGLILNVDGIAQKVGLSYSQSLKDPSSDSAHNGLATDEEEIVIFRFQQDHVLAVKLSEVFRLETFRADQIRQKTGQDIIVYRNKVMSLVNLAEKLNVPRTMKQMDEVNLIVFMHEELFFGIVIDEIMGIAPMNDSHKVEKIDSELIDSTLVLDSTTITLLNSQALLPKKEREENKVVSITDKMKTSPEKSEMAKTEVEPKEAQGWGLF